MVLPPTSEDGYESQNVTFSGESNCACVGADLRHPLRCISVSFLESISVPFDLLSVARCIQRLQLNTVLLRNFTLRDMHLFILNA